MRDVAVKSSAAARPIFHKNLKRKHEHLRVEWFLFKPSVQIHIQGSSGTLKLVDNNCSLQ